MVSVTGHSWKPCESPSLLHSGPDPPQRSPWSAPIPRVAPLPSSRPPTEEQPPSVGTPPPPLGDTGRPASTEDDQGTFLPPPMEAAQGPLAPGNGTDTSQHRGCLAAPGVHYDAPSPPMGPTEASPENDSTEVCSIPMEERLLKTNPIWFLADLQRKGAVHLLQGKEEGSFLVRQSSQSNTLAISVRLPPDKGPHVQHYLVEIQLQGKYSLEASENRFDSLPALLAHYIACCDELPVRLCPPKCVLEAKTRHELASIALLGQEFWGTPLASPSSPAPLPSPSARPSDLSFSSFGKGSTSSILARPPGGSPSPLSPPPIASDPLTPSRPAPPIPGGSHLSGDRSSLNLNLSSLEDVLREGPPSFSSFRSNGNTPCTPQGKPVPPPRLSPPISKATSTKVTQPPPPRASPSEESTGAPCCSSSPSNITVTTTLTFSVNPVRGLVPVSVNGVASPPSPPSHEDTFQLHVSSLEIAPSPREGLRLHFRPPSYSSPLSQPHTPLTPLSEDGSAERGKRRPSRGSRVPPGGPATQDPACHRSSLADKISDYEDLWTVPPPLTSDKEDQDFPSREALSSVGLKPRADISKSLGDLSEVARQEDEVEVRKASSPFYVEPLDALREDGRGGGRRKPKGKLISRKTPSNRHSDSNIEWRPRRTRRPFTRDDDLSSADEDLEEDGSSCSDHVFNGSSPRRRSKTALPSKVKGREPLNWVDASWEFLTCVGTSQGEVLPPGAITAQALIEQRLPHLVGTEPPSTLRHSAYDNVSRRTSFSDSGTEFSEPWDSRKWDSLLNESRHGSDSPESLVQVTGDSASDVSDISSPLTLSLSHKTNHYDTNLRSKILSPQMLALRHRKDAESGAAVRRYALALGHDASTTFSQAVRHFLTCTLEGAEREASVVVRNARQFMSGMKNYLVTSGEREFDAIVTRERSNLKSNEFLNLDAILEDVLVRLVLRPLWTHINQLFVDALTADGSIQRLATNMAHAKTIPEFELGIRVELMPPKGAALEAIQMLLKKMQHVYAPREKLGHLLGVVSHIYHAMYESGDCVPSTGDADDLVPMLMWVLAHSNFLAAEVEAHYLQGLLLPSSAGGEASYYLSAFHSAIHSLKNLEGDTQQPVNATDPTHSSGKESSSISRQGVLRVLVPDEKNGSIATRTLPIRPGSTARELCRMMAHKLKVTNPQDFALYKLIDGNESVLGDQECPQKVRDEFNRKGSHCFIAFKRIDAKIAWPIIS